VNKAPQLEGDLPTVVAKSLDVGPQGLGLTPFGPEQGLGHARQSRDRHAVLGNPQGNIGSRPFLWEQRSAKRAREQRSKQFSPARVSG